MPCRKVRLVDTTEYIHNCIKVYTLYACDQAYIQLQPGKVTKILLTIYFLIFVRPYWKYKI